MSIHTLGNTRGDQVFYIDESQPDFEQGIEKYYQGDKQAFIKDYYQSIERWLNALNPKSWGISI